MLLPLLSTWYGCAQQLGDVELSIHLLVEMLAHGSRFLLPHTPDCYLFAPTGTAIDDDEPDAIQEDLLAVFKVRTGIYHFVKV